MAPFGLLGGGGSKILCCCCGGSVEYSGMILISPTSGPRSSTSLLIRLQASSISWKIGSTTINPGAACVCKRQKKEINWAGCEQHLDKQWRWIRMTEGRQEEEEEEAAAAGGKRDSLLQYICSNYRSISRRKLNLDCSMLCWAPCGSVVKCSNHGKHGRACSEGTRTEPDRLKQGSLFHSAVL